jgi:hypothetical protein
MALYKAEDVVISATDGTLSSTGSDRLFVTVSAAVANNLAFTTQPGSGNNSSVWATQPIVTILDVYGNIVTGGIARSIALAIGNNPSTGTLSGTTSMNTSNGMTAYSDLSINKGGTGYTLIASTSGITSATSDPFDISNPAPTVSGISPNLVCAGGGSFTLAILGTNFNPQSVVLFNGLSRAITLQTDIELEVTILAGDIANGGIPSITVVNPTPGGGTSSGSTLTVSQIVITPSVTQPSCFADGSISLTVDGGTAPLQLRLGRHCRNGKLEGPDWPKTYNIQCNCYRCQWLFRNFVERAGCCHRLYRYYGL